LRENLEGFGARFFARIEGGGRSQDHFGSEGEESNNH